MLRHRGPTDGELLRDLSNGPLPIQQHVQNRAPRWIGNGTEDGRRRRSSFRGWHGWSNIGNCWVTYWGPFRKCRDPIFWRKGERVSTIAGMRRFPLATFLLPVACYTYAPIEPARIEPGTGVRARINGGAAERLAPLLGTTDARLVSGRLVYTRADTMIVEVPTVVQATMGSSMETLHQRVSISRTDLVELETRRLDRVRTAALAGGLALVVGAVVIKSLEQDPGTDGPPGGGGGTDARLPLWRLRF